MKVKLTNDTAVRYKKGTVIDVPEEEAKRLIAFKCAETVKEPAKKKPAKKPAEKK